MLRKPFHLITLRMALTQDPAWVGEVYKNPLPFPQPNRIYLLNIGTAAGILTEGWSDKETLDGLRDNLLSQANLKD